METAAIRRMKELAQKLDKAAKAYYQEDTEIISNREYDQMYDELQALEKETGIPLFERNRGEMKLTYAGSLFYEWAISTLHSHTQLEWKLGDIVSGSRTLIRLGLSPHRSERLLAPVLERF